MVIVAGHLIVAPEVRDGYLAGCADVVRQAVVALREAAATMTQRFDREGVATTG